MKRATCGFVVLLGLALNGVILAEYDEAHDLVIGTVLSVQGSYMEIDTHDGGSSFGVYVESWGSYKPKPGDNVRVHLRPDGRRVYADKIEKVGGPKKR